MSMIHVPESSTELELLIFEFMPTFLHWPNNCNHWGHGDFIAQSVYFSGNLQQSSTLIVKWWKKMGKILR